MKSSLPYKCQNQKVKKIDAAIIGAGAAGLFCSWLLKRAGLRTALLEQGTTPGRKLAASGGGHANFSNRYMDKSHFLCNPDENFCDHSLIAFSPEKFMEYIAAWGLTWEEREHGRLFLRQTARQLVRHLWGGDLFTNTEVLNIQPIESGFHIFCANGEWQAQHVILATGSPCRPLLAGCCGTGSLAGGMGLKMSPFRPALTPLRFAAQNSVYKPFQNLSGIGATCSLSLVFPELREKSKTWHDDILFTHRGLSGPAILSASLFWTRQASLEVNFLPGVDFENLLDLDENRKKTPQSLLRSFLPERLTAALLPERLATKKNSCISRPDRRLLSLCVHKTRFSDLRPEGMEKAEVCSGGISTGELNASTMESRRYPGMYICGEMIDVTGELGGYNLHWAFASAWCAAQHIIQHK